MSDRKRYSPALRDEHVTPLYRLARVRGVPMTSIVNDLLAAHLEASRGEIASYDPAVHDRKPRAQKIGTVSTFRAAA